jgi:hypothetical protein
MFFILSSLTSASYLLCLTSNRPQQIRLIVVSWVSTSRAAAVLLAEQNEDEK